MPEPLDELLESLCEVLEDDLDRQEDLLALCKAQGRAALEHDIELMEARTEAINALLSDTVRAEKRRVELAGTVVEMLQLPADEQTLSGLIAAAHGPWNRRMAEFQERMRTVLGETREVVRVNNGIMRRSVKVVNEALNTLCHCAPAAQGIYDARGGEKTGAANVPALLDQRG